MIVVDNLTKRYGKKTAVDGLTFAVEPGMVTGFLGPDGSAKSTTMRLILGLQAPTNGPATVNGKRYATHRAPLREVGVLLEARAVPPGPFRLRSPVGTGSTPWDSAGAWH